MKKQLVILFLMFSYSLFAMDGHGGSASGHAREGKLANREIEERFKKLKREKHIERFMGLSENMQTILLKQIFPIEESEVCMASKYWRPEDNQGTITLFVFDNNKNVQRTYDIDTGEFFTPGVDQIR